MIERGTKGIDTLLSFALFSIFPTILLLAFYSAILLIDLNVWVAISTIVMVIAYIWFTFAITRWRIQFRREMNQSRHRRQHQGGGQPAQFRDGQIFQQRSARDAALRRLDGEISPSASIQSQISLSISTPARPRSWRWAWAR